MLSNVGSVGRRLRDDDTVNISRAEVGPVAGRRPLILTTTPACCPDGPALMTG